MGRHTILNPKTGRRVYKTGRLGQCIAKGLKQNKKKKTKTVAAKQTIKSSEPPKKNKTSSKRKKTALPRKPVNKDDGKGARKFYGYKGATKTTSPMFKKAGKTKSFATRPSARACFDQGGPFRVVYGNKVHCMDFRANGSPFWKICS